MRITRSPLVLITTFLWGFTLAGSSSASETWRTGLQTITADELKSIVYFLSSDEMEGRDTGTLANRISSRYLAHQFELMGLQQSAGAEHYFQYLTLQRSRLEGANHFEFHRENSPLRDVGVLGEDFYPALISASGKVTAPLVLVGFGVTAPELDFDEYEGIDSDGAVVVIFPGLPGSEATDSEPFGRQVRNDYSSDLYKVKNAQEHGAVGAILLHENNEKVLASAAQQAWPEDEKGGQFVAKFDVDQVRIPVIRYAAPKIASQLQERVDLGALKEEIAQQKKPRSRRLEGFEVTIETQVARSDTRIRNVLAFLPGSDPILKEEVVIVSAHFDHIGERFGKINNGADDDASGTAGVLEIAEAFTECATRPRRSVLFALWNAEEKGLFGSRYYVEFPPIGLNRTVALFQLDMIGRNQEVDNPEDQRFRGLDKQTAEQNQNSVHVIGYSHSNDLRDLTTSSNESIGLELKFELDRHPLNIMRRSDHWPFLVEGVPSVLLTTGFHPDYHTPNDTADKINYSKLARIVRLAFLCTWNAANMDSRPQLNLVGSKK